MEEFVYLLFCFLLTRQLAIAATSLKLRELENHSRQLSVLLVSNINAPFWIRLIFANTQLPEGGRVHQRCVSCPVPQNDGILGCQRVKRRARGLWVIENVCSNCRLDPPSLRNRHNSR